MTVYVIWILDGPAMVTKLLFDSDDAQKQAFQHFNSDDWARMAYNEEYPSEAGFDSWQGQSYELITVFTADNIQYLY